MNEQILEYIKYGAWFLFGSGFVCEVTPFIKFNPISAILGWIGKKLNKDVEVKISELNDKVNTVQLDLQNHKVESWRRDILNFADKLSMGQDMTKEGFDFIIRTHDNYENYIKLNKIDNGQIDIAFSYISKKYNEHMENNSFYTGK